MLIPVAIQNEQAVAQIVKCNEKTASYGLTLTHQEALELVQTRQEALSNNGRIEFGGGIIDKLIFEFCDSSFLYRQNYAQTLHELLETFYYFKNESLDLLGDDELLALMKEQFENACKGSVALLQNRDLEAIAHNIRYGTWNYEYMEAEDGEKQQEEEEYAQ